MKLNSIIKPSILIIIFLGAVKSFVLTSKNPGKGQLQNPLQQLNKVRNSDDRYPFFKTTIPAQNEDSQEKGVFLSTSDQAAIGVVGTSTSLIVLVSEYVLKTTGCGLPAGPYGLIGAVEGISYLGVCSVAILSIYSKVKTGSGLPAGPKGVLGLAEGLSFLALAFGAAVLTFQLIDYGYVPNAVPMEGGMCQ